MQIQPNPTVKAPATATTGATSGQGQSSIFAGLLGSVAQDASGATSSTSSVSSGAEVSPALFAVASKLFAAVTGAQAQQSSEAQLKNLAGAKPAQTTTSTQSPTANATADLNAIEAELQSLQSILQTVEQAPNVVRSSGKSSDKTNAPDTQQVVSDPAPASQLNPLIAALLAASQQPVPAEIAQAVKVVAQVQTAVAIDVPAVGTSSSVVASDSKDSISVQTGNLGAVKTIPATPIATASISPADSKTSDVKLQQADVTSSANETSLPASQLRSAAKSSASPSATSELLSHSDAKADENPSANSLTLTTQAQPAQLIAAATPAPEPLIGLQNPLPASESPAQTAQAIKLGVQPASVKIPNAESRRSPAGAPARSSVTPEQKKAADISKPFDSKKDTQSGSGNQSSKDKASSQAQPQQASATEVAAVPAATKAQPQEPIASTIAVASPQAHASAQPAATTDVKSASSADSTAQRSAPVPASEGIAAAKLVAHQQYSQLQVNLQSQDLGAVQIRATMRAGQIGATVTTDRPEAREALNAAMPTLHQALRDRDVRVEQITIADRTAASGDSLQSGNGSQQQSAGQQQNRQAHSISTTEIPSDMESEAELEEAQTTNTSALVDIHA